MYRRETRLSVTSVWLRIASFLACECTVIVYATNPGYVGNLIRVQSVASLYPLFLPVSKRNSCVTEACVFARYVTQPHYTDSYTRSERQKEIHVASPKRRITNAPQYLSNDYPTTNNAVVKRRNYRKCAWSRMFVEESWKYKFFPWFRITTDLYRSVRVHLNGFLVRSESRENRISRSVISTVVLRYQTVLTVHARLISVAVNFWWRGTCTYVLT